MSGKQKLEKQKGFYRNLKVVISSEKAEYLINEATIANIS